MNGRSPPDAGRFRDEALREGFDEVLERRWEPDAVVESHTHPFAVAALVTQGEMWLEVDGAVRHLLPGDRFELEAGQPHAERYGQAGAVYWAARRHAG